ncbi:MAG: acyl-CoA dehydrogenase family protein, partial [bacterium]
MQYPFTEEQLALAQLTRDFMEREVAPVAAEIDARPDPRDCYPAELIRKASKVGLRTIAVPEEYGGIGAETTTKALALWTGAQIEIGLIKCLSQCWKVSTALAKCGTEAQKDKWLKLFAEDDDCVGSFLMTEPDYGSDNILRQGKKGLGLRTMAVKDGDHYVLNGVKRFCSLVSFSKILLVYARTDADVPVHDGTTCFIVPGDAEGVSYGRIHNKMGYRLYPNGETFFDNVRIHKDDILGDLNGGYRTNATVFRGSAELAACNTGLSRAVFDFCHQNAKERIQGGKPIIEHLTVRHMLAEMLMNIEVAEQFMWRICWGVENDDS